MKSTVFPFNSYVDIDVVEEAIPSLTVYWGFKTQVLLQVGPAGGNPYVRVWGHKEDLQEFLKAEEYGTPPIITRHGGARRS